ncbi:hypothetical protein CDCA_CDCA01G0326 [Cyanidium caldarium]|uniref:MARVEL domain-containing protein n=1 Tax=Cyanidium caldarium TaxID=2771 RepID=A0AAV9IQE5_CYACA|nr:hypothetical protein CDCA_CDCA01G0326 [Cyanidium caldarium]
MAAKGGWWVALRWLFYLVLMTLSIVVFACIVNHLFYTGGCHGYDERPGCNYAVAVGVISFVFAFLWLVWTSVECAERAPEAVGPIRIRGVEVVINGLVMLLWFVSGIVLSAQQNGISDCTVVTGISCGCARAALGISWINWVLELGYTIVLVVMELRN